MKTKQVWLFLIILFGVFIRLYCINTPLLDYHGHRQTHDAMIARNFYRHGFNIFYPEMDIDGNKPCYVGDAFPLFPYMVSLLYLVFGMHEILGRLFIIGCYISSAIFLFLLAKKYTDVKSGYFAVLIFTLSPMSIYYSRTFHRPVFYVLLSLMTLYYFSEWLDRNKKKYYIITAISGLASFLVYFPMAHIGLPMLYLAYRKYRFALFKQKYLWLLVIIYFLPTLIWYYRATHWMFDLISVGGGYSQLNYYFLWLKPDFWKVIITNLSGIILTPVGLALFLLGMLFKNKDETRYFLHIWLVSVLIYFALYPHVTYLYVHDYTYIPILPVAALFTGKTLTYITDKALIQKIRLNAKFVYITISIILFIGIGGIGVTDIEPYYHFSHKTYLVGKQVEQMTPKNSLVITIHQPGNPTLLYYSNRRGWIIPYNEINPDKLEELHKQKADYFVTTLMRDFEKNVALKTYLFQHYEPIQYNPEYTIFRIDKRYDQPSCIVTNANIQHPVDAIFGKKFKLLGYDLEKEKVRPGQSCLITYYWQTLQQNPSRYNFFVNVELQYSKQTVYKKVRRNIFKRFWGYKANYETADGRWISTRIFQLADPKSWVVASQNPTYPSTIWKPGEIIKLDYEIFIPIDAVPGDYRILTGVRATRNRLTIEPTSISDSAARFIGPKLEITRHPDFVYQPMNREEIIKSVRLVDSLTLSSDQLEREPLTNWKVSQGTKIFTSASKYVFINKIAAVYKDGKKMKLIIDRNPTKPDETGIFYRAQWSKGHRIYINDGIHTQPTAKYEVEYYPALPLFTEPIIREPLENWQISKGTRVFTHATQYIAEDKFITVYKDGKKMQLLFGKFPSNPKEAGVYFDSQWINGHRIYVDDDKNTSPEAFYEIEYYLSDTTITQQTTISTPIKVHANIKIKVPPQKEQLKNWSISQGTRVYTQATANLGVEDILAVYKNGKKMQIVYGQFPTNPEEAGVFYSNQWSKGYRIYINDGKNVPPRGNYEVEYVISTNLGVKK